MATTDALPALPYSLVDLPEWARAHGIAPASSEYTAASMRLAAVDSVAFAVALGFKPYAHHRLMLDRVRRCVEGAAHVGLIEAPPGSAKSTYVTLIGAAYILARNPRARLILATNSERLSEHWGRRLRNLVDSPMWRELARYAGDVSGLSPVMLEDSRAAHRFDLQAGGGALCVGWGSNLLGQRCDYLLFDDLVESYEVAFSETQLAKLATWIKTDAVSRLDG